MVGATLFPMGLCVCVVDLCLVVACMVRHLLLCVSCSSCLELVKEWGILLLCLLPRMCVLEVYSVVIEIVVVFVLLVPRGIVPSLGDVIEAAWRRRKAPADSQAATPLPQTENAQ